jgi:cellulose synthase/poly-beta-1,6-N-acetylglucosamine synthase-like glycosyltransferase
MMRLVFWAAAAVLAYSYLLFPVLVLVRGALRPRPHLSRDVAPSVSVVVAAHNEAATIGRKLETVLAADYPRECLEVVVASDGSDDGTDRVAGAFADRGVRVLALPRVGKAAALDAAVAASGGEILVLTDANSLFRPDTLRALVRAFADPHVGGVAGNQVYGTGETGQSAAGGERAYWDLDRRLKLAESRAGNAIAATGALYAIRRRHVRPIPASVTDDFFLSLAVIDDGARLVFEPEAVAYEEVAGSNAVEYRRRVRIMTRGLRCIAHFPRLLDPRRHGFYAVELASQKILMRMMAIPLALLAIASLGLWRRSPVYGLALVAQLASYALALAGLVLRDHRLGRARPLALPAYFLLVQVASLHATWNLVRGQRYDRWQPTRDAATAGDAMETTAPTADAADTTDAASPGTGR